MLFVGMIVMKKTKNRSKIARFRRYFKLSVNTENETTTFVLSCTMKLLGDTYRNMASGSYIRYAPIDTYQTLK